MGQEGKYKRAHGNVGGGRGGAEVRDDVRTFLHLDCGSDMTKTLNSSQPRVLSQLCLLRLMSLWPKKTCIKR